MASKRFKVETTCISPLSIAALRLGDYRLFNVYKTMTCYRWRWMATLRVWSDNSYSAFHPANVFGVVSSRLVEDGQ